MTKTAHTSIKRIFIDLPTVAEVVALSESTIQELVRLGQFPAPRQTSGRRVGWLVREVEQWAESRPASSLPPPPNTGAKKPRKGAEQRAA
ncbi:helix-turn-helix transcriptional regulator [Aromatoleum diolicum]|uniref:AlpA family phage regulatory protein n=1 Tax=Aromatoleum diolicum TaxID=75796 RepID=A0ABX1QI24_9RHOO|nr:AlpA family phage regulatory protein [Aromatoleum diolicum]NMG76874.1 AlpA family phage regulatory protein [Aromatoleum diolicum]